MSARKRNKQKYSKSGLAKGQKIMLIDTGLFKDEYDDICLEKITGIYYAINDQLVNKRIGIVRYREQAGDYECLSGWVDLKDAKSI